MLDKDKRRIVYGDESSLQTLRYGLYHNRKISSNPQANCVYLRFVETIHLWIGISHYGCTPFVVLINVFIKLKEKS